MLKKWIKNLPGEAFNFNNEEPFTIVEIVDKVLKVMESDLKTFIPNEASNEN